MPFTLSDAVAARSKSKGYPVEVPTKSGQTITVYRRPWSDEAERDFDTVTLEKGETFLSFRARQLLKLLVGWDVYIDVDELAPLNLDNLLVLESNDLEGIRAAVQRDIWQVPQKATSTTQSETSVASG